MTTVLIADDSLLLREGLAAVLTLAGMSVVARPGTAAALRAALAKTSPHVVLVGFPLAPLAGDEEPSVVECIRLQHPCAGMLVLAADLDAALALRLIRRRPVSVGYMLKQPVPEMATLVRALQVVRSGGTFVDQAVIQRLRGALPAPAARRPQ